jgi:DNA-binding GntR family transcriptional regulator
MVDSRLYTRGKTPPREPEGLGDTHKSLVATIVETLESRIISGALKPGERLVEQRLCEQFAVSRSPLREAIRILENQGFLIKRARRGVTVAEATLKEAIDVYTIRANLESLATFLAVRRHEPDLVGRLRELNAKMVRAVEKGDARSYDRLNTEFHDTLIQACGNERLIQMLTVFAKHTARYRKEVLSIPGKLEESVRKHEALIRSIESGDASGAERIRRNDILANIPLLEQRFNDNGREG